MRCLIPCHLIYVPTASAIGDIVHLSHLYIAYSVHYVIFLFNNNFAM
uniref:Uncharacterized protein n=1 Tax=Arundo donax TaxID=35708 RepID=A0A0A9AQH7_ARUDO